MPKVTEPIKKKETNEKLKTEVQKLEISDFMKKFIIRMIFFEQNYT